jgi:hypothetical protein
MALVVRLRVTEFTERPTSLINLALVPEFESLFVESLYLRPMQPA